MATHTGDAKGVYGEVTKKMYIVYLHKQYGTVVGCKLFWTLYKNPGH